MKVQVNSKELETCESPMQYTVYPCTKYSGSSLVEQHCTADVSNVGKNSHASSSLSLTLNYYTWQTYQYLRSKHIRTSNAFLWVSMIE